MEPILSPSQDIPLEAEVATCRGVTHERNEDAYVVHIEGGLFAIADGMGGHRDGHVASAAIVSVLEKTLAPDAPFEEKIETATRAIESVNASLYAQSRSNPDLDISGSTAVSLIVGEDYACCLWVGDSRLYLFRQGHLFLVSEDHAGPDGALLRAVGSAQTVEVDRRIMEIVEDDLFLLCSDGLLKGMNEDGLAELLSEIGEAPADRLLAKSIVGGSGDDITVILVWVGLRDD